MKKRIVDYIAFTIIGFLLLCLVVITLKLSDVNTYTCIKGFEKEKENELDVVMLGQSEVYADYLPTKAWQEYGYTSFSYGMAGMPGNMFSPALAQILTKQKPKVLVVEVNAFTRKDKDYQLYGKMHSLIDNLPRGEIRENAIKTYIPEDRQEEFYTPIATYHNNWKYLLECARLARVRILMALKNETVLKGYSSSAAIIDEKMEKDKKFCFGDMDKKCLKEFMDRCKESGIEHVLFVRFPHVRPIKNKKAMDELAEFIKDNGYEFLDLNSANEEIGIDVNKDYYDYDHMNVYGAEKNTKYLGKLLVQKYGIQTEHDNDCKTRWDSQAKKADEILEAGKLQIEKQSHRRIYEFMIR